MKNINKNILFIKIELFIFCFFLIFKLLLDTNIEDNNSFEGHISLIFCKFFYFERNYKCYNEIFNNMHFYEDIFEINENIHLFLNIKNTRIEKIFILIGLFPFLKNNSSITFKINDKETYQLFKYIFQNKEIRRSIIINKEDFHFILDKYNDLIRCNWELIPNKNITQTLRYIINNYYNETFLDIFDKSLNLNFKIYIDKQKDELSNEQIKELMCKFKIYLFIYIFEIVNVGVYEKEKCIGKGSQGRVSNLNKLKYYFYRFIKANYY